MFSHSFALVPLYLASLAATQTIQFDGRVPEGTKLTEFDSTNDLFGSTSVLGADLKFSDLLLLPNVAPSLFDDNTVPIEVTIKYAVHAVNYRASSLIEMLRSYRIVMIPFSMDRLASVVLS